MSTAKRWWLPSASFAVCGLSFLITAIWVSPGAFLPLGVAWFVIAVVQSSPTCTTMTPLRVRFSIRDVLWFTVVVALTVMWWLRSQQYAALAQSASIARVKLLEAQLSAAQLDAASAQEEAISNRNELKRLEKIVGIPTNSRPAEKP